MRVDAAHGKPVVPPAQAQAEPSGLVAQHRGQLAVGYKADVNILDTAAMRLHRPTVKADLPAGGRRLDQAAEGYVATIVSGEIIAEHGVPTAARPGRLVRGRQEAPTR